MPSECGHTCARMKNPAQILLIDERDFVRSAVRRLLEVDTSIVVCAEADSFEQIEDSLYRIDPDVIIMDLPQQPEEGLVILEKLKIRYPSCPILILSLHKESLFAEWALRSGAQGYLMKNNAADYLLTAVRTLLDGRIYVSEAVRQSIYSRIRTEGFRRAGTGRRRLMTA